MLWLSLLACMADCHGNRIIRAVILLLEKKAHNAIYGHKKSKRVSTIGYQQLKALSTDRRKGQAKHG